MWNVTCGSLSSVAAFLSTTKLAAAQDLGRGDGYYGHMWGGGYGMGYGLFGGLMMVLFWVVLIALVVIAVRWWTEQGSEKRSSAIDILQERLARGEIDAKEYAERKKALES